MQKNIQVNFTVPEIELLFNTDVFPLKRIVTEKLFLLFENMVTAIKDTSIHNEFPFPERTDITTGKISKGENYLQYPFVVLDFPRKFEKKSIFSIRNMFWFGHYFSSSIILGGDDMRKYAKKIITGIHTLDNKEIYFSFDKDPWNHKIEEPDQILIESVSVNQINEHIDNTGFLKLSHKFNNTDPKVLIETVKNYYEMYLRSIL